MNHCQQRQAATLLIIIRICLDPTSISVADLKLSLRSLASCSCRLIDEVASHFGNALCAASSTTRCKLHDDDLCAAAPTFMPQSGRKSHQEAKLGCSCNSAKKWLSEDCNNSNNSSNNKQKRRQSQQRSRQQIDIFNMRVQIDKVN